MTNDLKKASSIGSSRLLEKIVEFSHEIRLSRLGTIEKS